jgi:poly-gamma-glutamate capsule biosynthesis protein CapA/YwtB (metallophosphatase superfamily)
MEKASKQVKLKGGVETRGWVIDVCNSNISREKLSSVLFLGDVSLAHRVGRLIQDHGPRYPFERLPDRFFNAEVVCFNLECCLSERGEPWEPKPILMRGREEYLEVFPRGGQEYVANLSNNHFLDCGELGAIDTVNSLRQRGIRHIGAVGTAADQQPCVLDTQGGSLALLAFAPCAHPLPGLPSINIAPNRLEKIISLVSQSRSRADVLIVIIHQGIENSLYVDNASRKTALQVVEAGADCVICHHTHTVKGIEFFKRGLIFHGIGNFLIDFDTKHRPHAAYSLALRLELAEGRINKVAVEPFRINEYLQPCPLDEKMRDKFHSEITALSKLLSSKAGIVRNDLFSRSAWFFNQMVAFEEMVSRVGMRRTLSYYRQRSIEKFKNICV